MNNHDTLLTQLYSSLAEFKRVMSQSREQTLGQLQLTRTQIEVMGALRDADSQTIGEVAQFLGVTHSASTQTVETLVKRELVERFDDNSDRRIVRIRLSTSGRMLADNLHQQHLGRMNKVFSGLSDEELHVMLSVLSRLTQQFNDQKHAEGGE